MCYSVDHMLIVRYAQYSDNMKNCLAWISGELRTLK